jgi:hypothetical protein
MKLAVAVTEFLGNSVIIQFEEDNKYIDWYSQNSKGSQENRIIK